MRPAPFVVYSLPRSRSAWLSVLLGAPDAPVGHDIGPTLTHPSEFADRLRSDLVGTCETGAAFAWPLIRRMLPEARFMVLRRDRADVARSLLRFGFSGLEDELATRDRQLDEIAALPGVLSLRFEDLATEDGCAAAYRHCLGREMPRAWWRSLEALNVQVDMARQLALLTSGADRIATMKDEARRIMADA